MSGTEIAAALGKAVAPAAVGLLRSFGKKRYDSLVATYTRVFDPFLDSSLHKCRTVKTLLNSEFPVLLSDIYVDTTLSMEQVQIADSSLRTKIEMEPGGFVVTGLAGSGKSMFMKNCVLHLIGRMLHHQRIPLFIEVRDLGFDRLADGIERIVFDYCVSSDNATTFDQFIVGLREGIFILLFDGIDEAPVSRLDDLLGALSQFHQKFRQATIVASVRPGTKLPNFANFRVYKIVPMSLDQVLQVIDKAPYDPSRKVILSQALRDGLYDTHESFLSNPLLVTIVLITFDDASQIPKNLTGFYAAAFDALFGRHDWSKGIYVRDHKTKLEKAAFEKVFMHFCYLTYFYRSYVFDKDEVISVIDKALKSARVKAKPQDYLDDCALAVCLLQYDEPKVVFVHRSFQEYFTARFVSQYSGPQLPKMLDWLAVRSAFDNSFTMVAQLNGEAASRAWAVPYCDKVLKDTSGKMTEELAISILRKIGFRSLGADIKTGRVKFMGIDYEEGYGTYSSVLNLASMTGGLKRISLNENTVYPEGGFSKLPESTKRYIRIEGANDTVEFRISQSEQPEGITYVPFARAAIKEIGGAKRALESFLAARDEFAELVDLISPFEVGFEG